MESFTQILMNEVNKRLSESNLTYDEVYDLRRYHEKLLRTITDEYMMKLNTAQDCTLLNIESREYANEKAGPEDIVKVE